MVARRRDYRVWYMGQGLRLRVACALDAAKGGRHMDVHGRCCERMSVCGNTLPMYGGA